MREPDYKAMYEDAESDLKSAEWENDDLRAQLRDMQTELDQTVSVPEQIVDDLKNQLHRVDVLGLDTELTVSDVLRDAIERLERL